MDSSNLALSPQATSYLNRIVAEYNKEEPNYLAMEAALVDFSEKFGEHIYPPSTLYQDRTLNPIT
jgi:hypothetical protein